MMQVILSYLVNGRRWVHRFEDSSMVAVVLGWIGPFNLKIWWSYDDLVTKLNFRIYSFSFNNYLT